MGKYAKLREKILAGGSDGNIDFAALANYSPGLVLMSASKEIITSLREATSPKSLISSPMGAKPSRIRSSR
ncbi:MAG: hypothetical protein KIT57_11465 [Blastocatellales bacterium]|nr:hypothetical protein [Blastocatellales bacterium]